MTQGFGLSLIRVGFAALLVRCVAAEEKQSSWMGMAIASTLMGCIYFQIGLFYIVNHQKPAMRKHAYDIINQFIAILSAVLIFQSVDDQIEYWCLKSQPLAMKAAVGMLQMLFWFALLQVTLAWVSGALGKDSLNEMDSRHAKTSLKHWSILLAHITGFASINAWGSLQQLDIFRGSQHMCLFVVALSFVGQWLLFGLMYLVRMGITKQDEERVVRHGRQVSSEWRGILKIWEEETEESENDIMGLTLSFNATQAIRYHILGNLPNQEGEENEQYEASRTTEETRSCTMKLIGVSMLCVIVLFWFYLNVVARPQREELDDNGDDDDDDDDNEGRSRAGTAGSTGSWSRGRFRTDSSAMIRNISDKVGILRTKAQKVTSKAKEAQAQITQRLVESPSAFAARGFKRMSTKYSMIGEDSEEHEDGGDEDEEETGMKTRLFDMTLLSLSMTFSWCMFFALQMYLRGSRYVIEPMLQAVVLPLFLSFVCLLSIRGLQFMLELECTDARADKATTEIIKAIAILIGFSWERCFDEALTVISHHLPSPHRSKFCLALACVVIVLPAWKRWLLPYSVKDGWRFGFVIEVVDKPTKWALVLNAIHKQFKTHIDKCAHPDHPEHENEVSHKQMRELWKRFSVGRDSIRESILNHPKARSVLHRSDCSGDLTELCDDLFSGEEPSSEQRMSHTPSQLDRAFGNKPSTKALSRINSKCSSHLSSALEERRNDEYHALAGSEEEHRKSSNIPSNAGDMSEQVSPDGTRSEDASVILSEVSIASVNSSRRAQVSTVNKMRNRILHLEHVLKDVLEALQEKEGRDRMHAERLKALYEDVSCHGISHASASVEKESISAVRLRENQGSCHASAQAEKESKAQPAIAGGRPRRPSLKSIHSARHGERHSVSFGPNLDESLRPFSSAHTIDFASSGIEV